ncbi:Uncharacterised protein [Bordetella pertussis]|nr:Uncharacterised protein [Bordetella pertussis]CFL90036.1 Uncharacterised protein [Bordetella pertussis]CFM02848.1 Uncharacterised protein [Bordetella pertussis]CFM21203.1 Uncharacterised protein [Bordetella pertussis]CFM37465.1 Uncharacterised protein [Bordetella pertussis]
MRRGVEADPGAGQVGEDASGLAISDLAQVQVVHGRALDGQQLGIERRAGLSVQRTAHAVLQGVGDGVLGRVFQGDQLALGRQAAQHGGDGGGLACPHRARQHHRPAGALAGALERGDLRRQIAQFRQAGPALRRVLAQDAQAYGRTVIRGQGGPAQHDRHLVDLQRDASLLFGTRIEHRAVARAHVHPGHREDFEQAGMRQAIEAWRGHVGAAHGIANLRGGGASVGVQVQIAGAVAHAPAHHVEEQRLQRRAPLRGMVGRMQARGAGRLARHGQQQGRRQHIARRRRQPVAALAHEALEFVGLVAMYVVGQREQGGVATFEQHRAQASRQGAEVELPRQRTHERRTQAAQRLVVGHEGSKRGAWAVQGRPVGSDSHGAAPAADAAPLSRLAAGARQAVRRTAPLRKCTHGAAMASSW